MMPDIFSSFDPYTSMFLVPATAMFLVIGMSLIVNMNLTMLPLRTRLASSLVDAKDTITLQLMRTGSKSIKGLSMLITSIFMAIILINLTGMAPYMFSLSSHLILTLSLGFPVWVSMILSSSAAAPKKTVAHFLPDGAPDWLNPFLVLIETTSVAVRPLTLSFRLAANMTAGHVVLGLVGIYSAAAIMASVKTALMLILIMSGYILFEFAICLIQAYIFCLLLSLYSDDHAH